MMQSEPDVPAMSSEPGGFPAISRGLSEATPPETIRDNAANPGGVVGPRYDPSGVAQCATTLRPRVAAQPGANGSNPFGISNFSFDSPVAC